MNFPKELMPATAEKCWIIWGPCSGGMECFLLFQGHVFFYAHYGNSGREEEGIPAATFLTNLQREAKHQNIQNDLISLGYGSEH